MNTEATFTLLDYDFFEESQFVFCAAVHIKL